MAVRALYGCRGAAAAGGSRARKAAASSLCGVLASIVLRVSAACCLAALCACCCCSATCADGCLVECSACWSFARSGRFCTASTLRCKYACAAGKVQLPLLCAQATSARAAQLPVRRHVSLNCRQSCLGTECCCTLYYRPQRSQGISTLDRTMRALYIMLDCASCHGGTSHFSV